MKQLLFTALLLLLACPLTAQEPADEVADVRAWRTPGELAAESDYVVLAKFDVYNYRERRNVPVSGSTWFDVLLSYKGSGPRERFKVNEQGVGERKCYFDDVELWAEPPRYLLFLIDDPERRAGEVRGHPDGCALAVLTSTDNEYIVRWPIEHLRFDTDVEALVREYSFQGPGMTIDLADYLDFRREEEIARRFLEPVEDERGRRFIYRYTRGIPLSDFRRLMGRENLVTE